MKEKNSSRGRKSSTVFVAWTPRAVTNPIPHPARVKGQIGLFYLVRLLRQRREAVTA
jgi:hypothetical protein